MGTRNALKVSYMGDDYWIALRNSPGSCDAAQSMHVLSLVQLLLDSHKSSADLPTTGSVRIVP